MYCKSAKFLYFQLKPVSTTAVLAADASSVSSLLLTQHPLYWYLNALAVLLALDQITPVSTKRSTKESREPEEILNVLKTNQEQTKKTLDQIGSTLAASSLDLKQS